MKTNVGLILLSVSLLVCSLLFLPLFCSLVSLCLLPIYSPVYFPSSLFSEKKQGKQFAILVRPLSSFSAVRLCLLVFFSVLPLFSSSSPLFFSSLCFLFPAVRELFFRPSWLFFFSLLCFFEKKQRNESLLVALFSSLYYVCSEGEGGGATGDEVGAPVLAGQCASLFFFFVSPVFSLSVPLVLFSSSPPFCALSSFLAL